MCYTENTDLFKHDIKMSMIVIRSSFDIHNQHFDPSTKYSDIATLEKFSRPHCDLDL